MATLESYMDKLSRKISTSSTNFFEEPARIDAINDAIAEFCDMYQVEELQVKAELEFTEDADGYFTCALPADLGSIQHITKLRDIANKVEYTFVSADQFYDKTSEGYYTYDFSVDADDHVLFISGATDDVTLLASYRSTPVALADYDDETILPDRVTEIIALLAGVKLMAEAQDNDHLLRLEKMLRDAVSRWKGQNQTGSKRLVSAYEYKNFYQRF